MGSECGVLGPPLPTTPLPPPTWSPGLEGCSGGVSCPGTQTCCPVSEGMPPVHLQGSGEEGDRGLDGPAATEAGLGQFWAVGRLS